MRTETIEVPTDDGPMPVYQAAPDTPVRGAVVVVQEVFGVNEHIQDVTRRFADAGYHAVAPHVFHRAGGGTVPYDDFSKALPLFEGLTDDALLGDVDASVAHLNGLGFGSPRIGVVGFCWGGRATFLIAAQRPLGAAVGFYGGGIVTSRFPQFPALVDQAPNLKTPWLGLFGDRDQSIPVEDVERLETELGHAAVAHEVVRYPDAGHGFHCDARPDHYDPQAASDAWSRTLDWLGRHLADG